MSKNSLGAMDQLTQSTTLLDGVNSRSELPINT